MSWALARITELDIVAPGLAGIFLRASDERRQVLAAFLAVEGGGRAPDQETADILMTSRHDDLLRRAFINVPTGYRSALGRAGRTIHPKRFYRYLHLVLSARGERQSHDVVQQLSALDPTRLRVLRVLPEALRSSRLVALHRDVAHARETAALYRLLVETGVDADTFAKALKEAETARQLSECWRRWSWRVRFPEPPVAASPTYTPVTEAPELKRLALRFQNCGRRYLADVLEGRHAFAIFDSDAGEAVVHLRHRDDRWWLKDAIGRRNLPISSTLRREVEAHLACHGIETLPRPSAERGKSEVLRAVSNRWEYGDEEGGW